MRFLFAFLFFHINLAIASPVVSSVTPFNGSRAGGNLVTISGKGFLGASAVNFGGRPAVAFNVISDTVISATVPPGTSGTVNVRVTALSGTSTLTRDDFYTYRELSWKGIVSEIANVFINRATINPTMRLPWGNPMPQLGENSLTLFESATDTISNVIPLPEASLSATITPDGTTIFTANSSAGNVSVIDAAINVIVNTIPTTTGPNTFDSIISPDGKRMYMSNLNTGFVTVIDTIAESQVTSFFAAPLLGPLSITPDGKTVYVSSFLLGNVTPIDTATNTLRTPIPTGAIPGMTSITPDGIKAYVANSGSDTVTIFDVATESVIGTIPFLAGSRPYGSSILPNGQTMYVANIGNDTVTIIDLSSDSIVGTIPLVAGSQPFWAVSTPDSKKVFVLNEIADTVTPIDVASNTAGVPFSIDREVQDLVMSPDPAPVAYFTITANAIGNSTLFDASASFSPIEITGIASYAWDFGDGTMLTTVSPFVNHTYTSAGTFLVTLTVTNTAGTSTAKVFSSRFMSNNGGYTAVVTHLIVFPNSPIDVRGFQRACKFVTWTDRVNVIKWQNPPGPPPVAYKIFSDAALTNLLATIPESDDLIYEQHKRKKGETYTYYLLAVSSTGVFSPFIKIVIP